MKGQSGISRRDAILRGGSALAVLAFFDSPLFAWGREGKTTVPFLDPIPDPPAEIGGGMSLLDWTNLDSWLTPTERFFRVGHYGTPDLSPRDWRLRVDGLIGSAQSYTLDQIKALPKNEVVFTLECSGNSGFPWFQGGIGNARWGGTPLAPILEKAGLKKGAVEVVFYGADAGEETVPYITGTGQKLSDLKMTLNFARSMSVEEAMDPANLLCYEMNGVSLPRENGFPVRLIAPRWYGISNVKWLTRIEVLDARFMGPYMAERYVTVREKPDASGQKTWLRTQVGKALLKSITAKVTVKEGVYRIYGAAWGAPGARAEVQIDGGSWMAAVIDQGAEHDFAWKFWHLDWPNPSPGEHRITSRAIDKDGNVQPAMDDWRIANKHTYWESNGQITRRVRIA